MSLDPAYLDYPLRRRGMDHDLYAWSALHQRPPVAWPGGRTVAVAIVVALEYFPLTPSDTPFRAPGHMATPFPDFRHYTARDYGTRRGMPRLLDAFAAVGARVSVAANAAACERNPELIARILADGHEIVAHSTDMNGTIAGGLAEADERALIVGAHDRIRAATGVAPAGWLSIARSQSWNTPRLLAEAGFDYMLDWVNDELPYRFGALTNLPLNHELSDRQVIGVQQQSAESYVEQLSDAFDWLAAEAAESGGGRLLPVHLTPYIIGLPYRIDALERWLGALAARRETWFAPAGEIVAAWTRQAEPATGA